RHRPGARRAVAHQVALDEFGDGARSRSGTEPELVWAPSPNCFYFSACSTARLHITVMRCARYSGEACRSLFSPSGLTVMLATASGANLAASAFSISVWRNAHA